MKTTTHKQDLRFKQFKLDPISLTLSNQHGQSVQFTRREFQVFHFLFNNIGKIINKYILMDLIWDIGTFSTSNSLEVHLSNLRKKITTIDAQISINTLRGVGYSLQCL
ncbi:helix-turn-helix domain-containing protein [Candidatus Peregrinibacteria bacterium]|nr:helix-turn-helix domain-containing protein [Candidatus Peregrinibacteria bacterium]